MQILFTSDVTVSKQTDTVSKQSSQDVAQELIPLDVAVEAVDGILEVAPEAVEAQTGILERSEERRVGKEC